MIKQTTIEDAENEIQVLKRKINKNNKTLSLYSCIDDKILLKSKKQQKKEVQRLLDENILFIERIRILIERIDYTYIITSILFRYKNIRIKSLFFIIEHELPLLKKLYNSLSDGDKVLYSKKFKIKKLEDIEILQDEILNLIEGEKGKIPLINLQPVLFKV